jgi:hypothetical protein
MRKRQVTKLSKVCFGSIVLKKPDGNFNGGFPGVSTVQLTGVRAMVAVLDGRDTDLSFPCDTKAEFFNAIGRILPYTARPGVTQDSTVSVENHAFFGLAIC